MNKSLLLGLWRFILRIPRPIWQQEVARSARASEKSLAFMTADHRKVRDFVVREMPRIAKPISPELIAQSLDMKLEQVLPILDELEKKLTFLYRNEEGAVIWAYPVTVEQTPHCVTFSTRRADLCRLRHRRDCDALRARATPKRSLDLHHPDRMRPLRERNAH